MRHLANVAPTVRALLGIAQTADTEAPLGELLDTVSVRDGEMAAR
jgi:hypothetical protein